MCVCSYMGLALRIPVSDVCEQQGTDQPVQSKHLCNSLFGTYHIYQLQVKFPFQQVSIAEEAGLSLAFSETPKTGFNKRGSINIHVVQLSVHEKSNTMKSQINLSIYSLLFIQC